MRYVVRAKLKPGREQALSHAIQAGTLGQGSVAQGEYLRNVHDPRHLPDGTTRWVEVCYCPTPLQEERPYWEEFFELAKVQDAHNRRNCRDSSVTEPWACDHCDCTARLEARLATLGRPLLDALRKSSDPLLESSTRHK